MADVSVLDRPQATHPYAPIGREVDDLARVRTTEVLCGDPVAFDPDEVADEADIALPHVGHAGEDATASEQLDLQALAQRPELQQVVDQALHRIRPVTGGEPDRRVQPAVGSDGGILR